MRKHEPAPEPRDKPAEEVAEESALEDVDLLLDMELAYAGYAALCYGEMFGVTSEHALEFATYVCETVSRYRVEQCRAELMSRKMAALGIPTRSVESFRERTFGDLRFNAAMTLRVGLIHLVNVKGSAFGDDCGNIALLSDRRPMGLLKLYGHKDA